MIINSKKPLLASILLASALSANDTLTQVSFEQDNDGNFNPNIFIPVYWTDNVYSGIGYTSNTTKDIGVVDGFIDSKNGMVATSRDMRLNWLTYKFGNFSAGLQSNFLNIDKNEFGYIHDSADLFGNGTNYYIAFDNDIELDIVKTGFYIDYSTKIDNLLLRGSSTITPSTKIDVKQSTLFKPLVNDIGSSSSSTSQDLSYGVKLEAYYDTNSFVKLGFEYSYDYMPIKYDIAQLAVENNAYVFNTTTIDTDETTTKYLAKLYFDKKMLGGLTPTIGFGSIETEVKNNDSGKKSKSDESIVSVGFERRF